MIIRYFGSVRAIAGERQLHWEKGTKTMLGLIELCYDERRMLCK